MTDIRAERLCAEVEGEFVVFLIGMRINRFWKFGSWLPVAMAMPRMLAELEQRPELGLMHYRGHFGLRNAMVLQYWRSFEHLEAYARNTDSAHLPAWQAFNRAIGSNGDVGIWHETYVIRPGAYESIYNNMPTWGLGAAGKLVEARGHRKAARERLAATDG
ncbi:MAG: DUF4188 domain-containing protein [Pseudomonadota bacterium]